MGRVSRSYHTPVAAARRAADTKRYHDSLPWNLVAEVPPPASEHLMLRLDDGTVSAGSWLGADRWQFGPHDAKGTVKWWTRSPRPHSV